MFAKMTPLLLTILDVSTVLRQILMFDFSHAQLAITPKIGGGSQPTPRPLIDSWVNFDENRPRKHSAGLSHGHRTANLFIF